MNLYAATALVDGQPTGAFLLARDPDEAASKAIGRLPNGGKLTHIVHFCEARTGTLQRNRLYEYCPKTDQVEFACESLLQIIGALMQANNSLRAAVGAIHDVVTNQFGMRQFTFTVTEPNGVLQFHNCFHFDLPKAKEQAKQFARDQYGEGAEVTSIQEVTV